MLQNIYCWYLPKLTPVIRFNMLIFKKIIGVYTVHYTEAYYSIPHIASFFLLSSEDHTLMAECTVPSHQLTLTSVFHTFTAWDEQSYTRRSLQLAFRSHSPGCAWNVCSHFPKREVSHVCITQGHPGSF